MFFFSEFECCDESAIRLAPEVTLATRAREPLKIIDICFRYFGVHWVDGIPLNTSFCIPAVVWAR